MERSALSILVPGEPALISISNVWTGPSNKLAILTVKRAGYRSQVAPFLDAGYTELLDEADDEGNVIIYLASEIGVGGFYRS